MKTFKILKKKIENLETKMEKMKIFEFLKILKFENNWHFKHLKIEN